ncbi:MAG: class I SAM-dependent methyltransferase [Candidatus Aenigmatarchaeota archaeon]
MRDIKELYKADYPQEVFIRRILSAHIQVFFEKYLLPLAHRNMRVLDVGCGEQPFRSVIEQYGFCYKGLDRRQNSKQNVDIIVPIDDPLFDNYSIEPFDFVLCTEVLEHVANWEVAFKNIAKLTKKMV